MEDLQLNVSIDKKHSKSTKVPEKTASEYKFLAKPKFHGRTIARKRPQSSYQKNISFAKQEGEPQKKILKIGSVSSENSNDMVSNLRDLSENKGKYQGKNYQELSDDIKIKQKPRSGGWVSSLFKNNPDVPRVGQRLVKPIVEKVFAGKKVSDLDLHPHSVANLQQNLSIKDLMTVQQNSIPVILQGRDVLIRSQTGSGKTLAYALPIIEGLQAIRPKINRHDGIKTIVVVPTRELAVQTYELFIKLVKPFTWIVPGLLSGGQKRKAEKARLRKGLNILIGTPGRINDHLRHTKSLDFSKTSCLVLDEADRLLDMGYEKDVAAIVKAIEDHKKAAEYDPMALVKQTVKKNLSDVESHDSEEHRKVINAEYKHNLTNVLISKKRQTILLSATLTKAVENLAGITMVDPVFVDTSEGRAVVADSLKPKRDNTYDESKNYKVNSEEEEIVPLKRNMVDEANNKLPSENNDEIHFSSRRGLKSFNGSRHPDLFNKNDKNINVTSKTTNTHSDESDSDSDYEYFKYAKELTVTDKDIKIENLEEDIKPSVVGNTFEEALKIAIVEDELVLPETVNQTFLVVPMKLRLVTLCSLIIEHCVLNKKGGKMIIFMGTLEMVDYHAELIETVLSGKKIKKKDTNKSKNVKTKRKETEDDEDTKTEKGGGSSSSDSESYSDVEVDIGLESRGGLVPVQCDVFSLHGSMPHQDRMEVFSQFRAARRGVLFCTDVAARGLDVPRVDLVLQYCAPASATDYVHRVGRTGRATQVGAAVLFLLPSEVEFVRHLEHRRIRLRQSDEKQALEALRSVVPAAANAARAAIAVQTRLESVAHSSKDWLARASRAYTSWVRFYAGYPREVRQWLDAKQLHLGHAAKAFALRDTPAALARRTKSDPKLKKEKSINRLTVHEEEDKKRPGFPKIKFGSFGNKIVNKQTSMHTASEFDSGLTPVLNSTKKKLKKVK